MTAGEGGVKNGGIFLAWRPGSTQVETRRARTLSTTHGLTECKQMYIPCTDRVKHLGDAVPQDKSRSPLRRDV
jgi:hypothetical protein